MNALKQRSVGRAKISKAGSMDFKQVASKLGKIGVKVTTDTKNQLNQHRSIIVGNNNKIK